LDYELFKKHPKPLIGFSDVSAILLAVNKLSGIKTYMGPSGITFDKPDVFEYSYEYLMKIIFDKTEGLVIEDAVTFADDLYFLRSDSNHRIIQQNTGRKIYKQGIAEGRIIASNLQTLLVLSGTKYFPNLKNKILFLEESEDEDTAMIHRFFTHLSQSVNLSELKGIVIGKYASKSGFTDIDSEEMVYDDAFHNLNIPIIYNLNFGHTDPLFTIPNGGLCHIDTKKNILLIKDFQNS